MSPTFKVSNKRLEQRLCGMAISNPVGLAAGYDKDCEFLQTISMLGFGYVTGGTVLATAQQGNPKPRMFRYSDQDSLINSLGFPSLGVEHVERELRLKQHSMGTTPVVISVSGITADDILTCHTRLEPLVDAIEVNISSPNTSGLRIFHDPGTLKSLLDKLNDHRKKRLFVKLPPYSGIVERDTVLALVTICLESGVDAVTAANSQPASDAKLAVGSGGISGRAVFQNLLHLISDVKTQAGNKLEINACGGIFTGEDAWAALQAGASTVQLLTGLIYRGPTIASLINQELLKIMDANNTDCITDVQGRCSDK